MSKNKQKESTQSKLQIFFIVVVIPALFVLILAFVLLYYAGFNVGEQLQRAASFLPFVENEQVENEVGSEEYIAQLEHENNSYSQQITQLENQIATQDEEIASLEEELIAIQSEEVSGEESNEVTADVSDIVKTLEGMTASRAADIVSELPEEEAMTYLRMMRVNSRSDILSRMDAEIAAQLLSQMSN